jgi:DNA end-binding protein Ku
MARRPIWSGSISFGLVNIPVKLFSAISEKEVRFHQVHGKDGGRIQYKRFCAAEDVEVPWDEIVKGYPISRHRIVTITPEELEEHDPETTRTIDITEFVDLATIDPIFYDRTYYLAPDRGAERAYALLFDAMAEKGRVGIARIVMRTKQYLCAVRPMGSALALTTMQYHDEIIGEDELELPKKVKPSAKELAMASQLIDSLAGEWDPTRYEDTYRKQILELIERKAEGEPIEVKPEARARPGEVVDLFSALQASLAGGRRNERPAPVRKRARRSGSRGRRTRRAA